MLLFSAGNSLDKLLQLPFSPSEEVYLVTMLSNVIGMVEACDYVCNGSG